MPGKAGRNRTRQSHHHWNHIAASKPEAQTLAQSLNLDFPTSPNDGFKSELIYPIRRLTIIGKDTPENFTLLLGPLVNKVDTTIKQARVEVLLLIHLEGSCSCCSDHSGCGRQAPCEHTATELETYYPPASPYSVSFEQLDEGSTTWEPRFGSEDELCTVGGYRRLKADSIAQVRSRGMGVEEHDVRMVLGSMEKVDGWTKYNWECKITPC